MATGDTVFEATSLRVVSDTASREANTTEQRTALTVSGAVTVPGTGSSGGAAVLIEPIEIALRRPDASSNLETVFDAAKQYKITITEV
ncbi:hypothetical protein SEA_LAZERLEMON_16 [Streptomyces phage LazerLemon]|nr:hypothetical protein SEA_LAZERLEMON_16 [Streptomyces phage LazerLemon]